MSDESKPAAVDELIGRRVGGYTITSRVGQGGMGIVYEAKHERILNQRAAIKVLLKELSADEKVLQRFFNEARAISVAQHSSIVKIFDFGQLDDGTAYIMMEFLEGETLLSRMERAQKEPQSLSLTLVVELGRQIAAALGLIHQKGIVHRDLKPENIFIVPDPVAPLGERVKLLDFGIAKFLDGPVRKTTVGMILGTPLYMSPEQCEGSEDLDAKVDVYALGVMLYEMICGHLPFVADTAAALMRQHMFKEPPALSDQILDLPDDVVVLVHAMLAKKAEDRPAMPEIAETLDALMAQLSPGGSSVNGRQLNSSGRRKQITVGGDADSPDPFASTLGGASGLAISGVRKRPSLTDGLASTMAESGIAGNPGGSVNRPSGALALGLPRPRVSRASGDLLIIAEPSESGPVPVNRVSVETKPEKRRPPLLFVLVGGAVLILLAVVLLRPRGGDNTHATNPTGSTTGAAGATGATGAAPANPTAPSPAIPPKEPVKPATTTAAAVPDPDGEDADNRKGRGKKGRSKGSKKREDGAQKKPVGTPETKSSTGEEPDVWR